MLNRATYNVNSKFKHCAVCALLLSALYNNSRPQQDYAKEQGNAVPVLKGLWVLGVWELRGLTV